MDYAISTRAAETGQDGNGLLRIHHEHISCALNLVEDLYVCLVHRQTDIKILVQVNTIHQDWADSNSVGRCLDLS